MSIAESQHVATVTEYLNLLMDSGLSQPAAVERTLDFAAALSHHADLSEGHIFAARIVHHAVQHLNAVAVEETPEEVAPVEEERK